MSSLCECCWWRFTKARACSIRRRIVHLLFDFPYSLEAESLDRTLWIQTSHRPIAEYRHQIQVLSGQGKAASSGPRPFVQLRKVQAKFRSFLAAEESFWSGLALRLVRTHALTEAKGALVSLDITSPDPNNPGNDISRDVLSPAGQNSDQSPPRISASPASPDHYDRKLKMVHRVLIYLGDLARYREMYSEDPTRPKSTEDKRGGKRKPGKVTAPSNPDAKGRDYSRAVACYEQARLMVPDDGNPSNQLAVLAVWSSDRFASAYHCYRAICVRDPFPTTRGSLESILDKTLENVRKGTDNPRESAHDRFQDEVVLLHALWLRRPR